MSKSNEEWIPVFKKRKRTCKRKDESDPVSASDDSADELKVKLPGQCIFPPTKIQFGLEVIFLDLCSKKPKSYILNFDLCSKNLNPKS